MINLSDCRFVVYGYKNQYHTHGHIHEAFYRALKLTGKDVQWLDSGSDLSGIDFSDSMFITEHSAAKDGMPIRDDCFYVVHGLNNDQELSARMSHIKNRLGWNVYHDYSHGNPERWDGQPLETVDAYLHFLSRGTPDTSCNFDRIFLAEDTPFYPKEKHMDFRWATDQLPAEIEALKPAVTYQKDSDVINWVGTQWFVNQVELGAFKKACAENNIEFKAMGAGQNGVVSIEDNVRLVRESYFAPAIVGSHHITEGYAPCRIFKNISYGAMGVTNSPRVNNIFDNKLIFNPDPYRLFYDAKEQLPGLDIRRIHDLMDEVSKKHTYLNRLNSIMKAAQIVIDNRS